MMVMPVMAAGPERAPLPQTTPEATITSPLPTPTPAAQVTPESTPESQPGFEAGDENGKFVFGGTYTLRSDERLSGDLVVFGGVATVQADSRVNGNVVLFGGSADIAGRIDGDLVLIGGGTRLRSTAVVQGQLVRVGGGLQKDAGAQIHEGETGGAQIPPIPPVRPVIPVTPRPETWAERGVNRFLSFTGHMAGAVGTTIVLTVLAVFVVALWREPVDRVGRTIKQSPGVSWVVGFLTPLAFAVIVPAFALLSGILVIACGLGLVGIMLIVVAAVAIGAAWVMGWIAMGQLIGERLLTALGTRYTAPAVSAAAGTAVLSLLWLGLDAMSELWCIGLVSVLGWVLFMVLAPIGLGAVVLTRFGRQEYIPNHVLPAPVVPVAPPAPPAPPEPPQPAPADVVPSGESIPPDKPEGEL